MCIVNMAAMELLVNESSASCLDAMAIAVLVLPDKQISVVAGDRKQRDPILKVDGRELEGDAALLHLRSLLPESLAADSEWAAKVGKVKGPALALELEKQLEDKVFVVGGLHPTLADALLFANLRSLVKKWKAPERCEKCNVTRWFDLLQSRFPDALSKVTIKLAYTEPAKKDAKGKGDAAKGASDAKGKDAKEKGGAKGRRAPAVTYEGAAKLDIRVGRVLSAKVPPEAEKLYLEEIDIGEDKPRIVVSGLVQFVSKEELEGRLVLVVTNLKPAKLAGIMSYGLVLCASNDDHTKVEILSVPEGSSVGERVQITGVAVDPAPSSVAPKVWSKISKQLKTNDEAVACVNGAPLTTASGVVKATTLANAVFK